MSIVIGTHEFIIGDRRVVGSGERYPPHPKVFANRHLVIGSVGSFAITCRVERLVAEGAHQPAEFVRVMTEDSEALLLVEGQLWWVGEEWAQPVEDPYHAIGSGGEAARGYLAGAERYDEETCRRALEFVSSIRLDCGDGSTLHRHARAHSKLRQSG